MRLQYSWRYKATAGVCETAVGYAVLCERYKARLWLVYVRLQHSWRYKAIAGLRETAVFMEVQGYDWSM